MKKTNTCDSLCGSCSKWAWILVIIGALNWGLVGLGYALSSWTSGEMYAWDLVAAIFGGVEFIQTLIYLLVGIAGVMVIKDYMKMHKKDIDKMATDTKKKIEEAKDKAEEVAEEAKEKVEELKDKAEKVSDAVKGALEDDKK